MTGCEGGRRDHRHDEHIDFPRDSLLDFWINRVFSIFWLNDYIWCYSLLGQDFHVVSSSWVLSFWCERSFLGLHDDIFLLSFVQPDNTNLEKSISKNRRKLIHHGNSLTPLFSPTAFAPESMPAAIRFSSRASFCYLSLIIS